jgi:hypothetical protein
VNEARLNDLAHLFINRGLKFDYHKVIDLFWWFTQPPNEIRLNSHIELLNIQKK